MLDANPNVRLAIVGQGPYREDLEKIFEGTKTVFTVGSRDLSRLPPSWRCNGCQC